MGKSLARLLIQSKTLEEVSVLEFSMDCDVNRLLVEGVGHSSVVNLKLMIANKKCRETLTNVSFPRDRVTFVQ